MVTRAADQPKESLTNKVCKTGYGVMVVAVFILGVLAIVSKP